MNDLMTNTFYNSYLLPPSGETMQSAQILLSKDDLIYFDRYNRHKCLHPNYDLQSQYFCDNMNDYKTEIILSRVVEKTVCEAISCLIMVS